MTNPNSHSKPKLAIVSTYDELCGIAGYTRALVDYLSLDFDIEVFDLDQYLLRASGGRLKDMGDAQVREFCARFEDFDAVNLQLEYGTLGALPQDILRRFQMIVKAAPKISVTFHTILPSNPFPNDDVRIKFFKLQIWNTYTAIRDWRRAKNFRAAIYHTLREAQKTKPVSIIVHTKRDARAMRLGERFEHVFDHPLAFLPPARAKALKAKGTRKAFPRLSKLSSDDVIIGVFGFVSEYKGIHVAIKALSHLPDNVHLAVFGALHPGEIRPLPTDQGVIMHSYLSRLLSDSHAEETFLDALGGQATTSVDLGDASTEQARRAVLRSPRDVSARLHFMGVTDDDTLAGAMHMVDVAVLPYYEVGQASSGPMSLATEMGARMVASRNHAFLQYARYNPDRKLFFDVGNYLELAQRIEEALEAPRPADDPPFGAQTNRDIYRAAHSVSAVKDKNE